MVLFQLYKTLCNDRRVLILCACKLSSSFVSVCQLKRVLRILRLLRGERERRRKRKKKKKCA